MEADVQVKGKMTPLMQQYWEVKNQHPDKILLFRMGDFYEMFHGDAVVAAPILNIALTSRNKKSQDDTPMCGVPYHSVSGPIGKLLAAGLKVAICEQLEDPSEAKGLVKRGVTKILSPGMVYDPDTLAELSQNFVAAYDENSVAFLDASTGDAIHFAISDASEVRHFLNLLSPIELVLTSEQRSKDESLWPSDVHLTVFDDLDDTWPTPFDELPVSAQRLLTYTVHMQGPAFLSGLKKFSERRAGLHMELSANLLRHLEVFTSYRGTVEGSLFHATNRTKSSAGTRKLRNWLQFPLLDLQQIQNRQSEVRKWMSDPGLLKSLRQMMGRLGDLERRLSKVAYSSCHPRDLLSLKNSLQIAAEIGGVVKWPRDEELLFVLDLIDRAIVEEPPAQMKAGGFISRGFHPELDQLIDLSENASRSLAEMEARERDRTDIPSLKIRYNQVFGYYIEVTNTHKHKVPPDYRRKQTLANAERFVTDELSELEARVLSARGRRVELEDSLFHEVRAEIQKRARSILKLADQLSDLDVLSSLAWLSLEQNYVLPDVREEGELNLQGSRHPVVEQEVQKAFVPNDIRMAKGEVFLLTGPNMAGKSTIMRQVALTVLLGQIGAPVPCVQAEFPLFERIFTRIGASDFLSEGLSTFMVEMKESAEILRGLNSRSLVVLDEIGRGTSTYDGMSLAQAILEHLLAQQKSYVFFATHYHELTQLESSYANLKNVHMAIADRGGQIRFLHSLKKGPANKSYGIHVAELAGMPENILQRASQLLKEFERGVTSPQQMELTFAEKEDPWKSKLKDVDVSNLTPLEALNTLHKWQQELS